MADDKTKRAPQDASRISLNERYEVDYWTAEIGVSEERLRDLVKQHGNSAYAVRQAARR